MSYAAMAYYMAGQTPPTPVVVSGTPTSAPPTDPSLPVYGPPIPPPPTIYLQCGMCGQPVLGSGWIESRNCYGAPTPALGTHSCAGPFPVDMGDSECIGPWFDPQAPEGLTKVCCICLRFCDIEGDPDVVKGVYVDGRFHLYVMNDHQPDWHHT